MMKNTKKIDTKLSIIMIKDENKEVKNSIELYNNIKDFDDRKEEVLLRMIMANIESPKKKLEEVVT